MKEYLSEKTEKVKQNDCIYPEAKAGRFFLYVFWMVMVLPVLHSCIEPEHVEWPDLNKHTRPWTRWWWMGSAVTPEGLRANMEDLQNAGIGGVEITAIYGVKGYEERFIDFLSPQWMDRLVVTLQEAERLGLGVDLANASGWPFGGPWILDSDACKNIRYKKYTVQSGEILEEPINFTQEAMVRIVGGSGSRNNVVYDQVRTERLLPLQVVMAYSGNGRMLDLTDYVNPEGILTWKAPEGTWEVYAVFQGWHGKQVERAGPGGQGNAIDHFSEKAVRTFLARFDEAAENRNVTGIRAFFNDSYEVDDARGEANWTPLFFEEFRKLRGYDLRNCLPALFGEDTEEINARVRCDYRETLSDLLLERFTKTWAAWADTYHAQVRNQAHDSPANILDLYAAAGIPETEGTDPLGIRMASSAAHVTGKQLVSCEAATWLGEHFTTNLADLKHNIDRFFVNGINHIVYHGTPYSPDEAPWPGWMFYASTHLAPSNPLWDDLKTINDYVAHCQSFLQDAKPDNDILVYFPIYDFWMEENRSMLRHLEENARETPVKRIGDFLLTKGYAFDFISDKQIAGLERKGNKLVASGNTYRVLLVPECRYMTPETMGKILELAEKGAVVIFQNRLPEDVPGMAELDKRRIDILNKKKSVHTEKTAYGNGKILVGKHLDKLLSAAEVNREPLAESGLWFTRIQRDPGSCYLISNWSGGKWDHPVTVNASGKAAVMFDPMNRIMGNVRIKKAESGRSEIYLQMEQGETRILQFYKNKGVEPMFPVWEEKGKPTEINGEWELSFLKGGPRRPEPYKIRELKSWSQIPEMEEFSGTVVYRIRFLKPEGSAEAYTLDLGNVKVSARIRLNGEELGVLPGPAYIITLPADRIREENQLEIAVTNTMANRIIGMGKRGERYQNFYNINFAARYRENLDDNGVFTTRGWEPFSSGLLGPVMLHPLVGKNQP